MASSEMSAVAESPWVSSVSSTSPCRPLANSLYDTTQVVRVRIDDDLPALHSQAQKLYLRILSFHSLVRALCSALLIALRLRGTKGAAVFLILSSRHFRKCQAHGACSLHELEYGGCQLLDWCMSLLLGNRLFTPVQAIFRLAGRVWCR